MAGNKSLIQLIIEAIGAKKATDEMSDVAKKTEAQYKKLGEAMERTGKKMSVFITAPVVAGFAKMIDSASDMEETVNKVNVVFGEASGEVLDFGRDAARGLGMSRQSAMEAAGTFGNLFTSMGIGADMSADMSTELLTLAADLASFNNIDPTVALEKLRAGLVGEVEPLRTLGVNLSAVAVQEKAVEMGLIGVGEEMTAAAKAQASYALIMEQTTNAQGDFARTSDGLANSQRILKAEIQDVVAEMGKELLPIALDLVQGLRGLVGRFTDMDPAGKKAILVFMGIAASLGPVLTITGKIITILPALKTGFAALSGLGIGLGPLAAGLAAVGGSLAFFSWLVREGQHDSREFNKTVEDSIITLYDWDTALAHGIVTERQRRLIMNEVEKGMMTAAEAQEWLNEKIDNYNTAVTHSINESEARRAEIMYMVPALEAQMQAEENAALAAERVAQGMENLKIALSGRLGGTIDDFTEANAGLLTELEGVKRTLIALSKIEDPTSEQVAEMVTLGQKYNTLKYQYEENARVHREKINEILIDLLIQRAAIDGITEAEYNLILSFAESAGLIDEATVEAMQGIDEALRVVETDAGAAQTIVETLASTLSGIEGVYDVTFDVSVIGDDYSGLPSTSSNTYIPPSDYPVPQAEGGDWWVTRPTLFLAGEAGPERATFTPAGKAGPGGGDTYNIINRDKASAALALAWVSQSRDRRLNAEMGVA